MSKQQNLRYSFKQLPAAEDTENLKEYSPGTIEKSTCQNLKSCVQFERIQNQAGR